MALGFPLYEAGGFETQRVVPNIKIFFLVWGDGSVSKVHNDPSLIPRCDVKLQAWWCMRVTPAPEIQSWVDPRREVTGQPALSTWQDPGQ